MDSNTALLWSVLCLLYALCFGAVNPHPQVAGAVHLNQDMLWNVGNAEALSRAFPAEDARFSGVRLSYHYLTELLAAALHLVSGAALYDIYVFFAGPLFLAGELCALKAMARVYFGPDHPAAARRLVLLVFGFSCLSLWKVLPNGLSLFGNTMLAHLVTNVNSQATALVFLGGFAVCFTQLGRTRFAPDARLLLGLFVSFFLLCVAKGPEAAIVVCSLAVTMVLVLLFQRPHYGTALLCLFGLCAVFAAAYFVLFASGTNSMELSLFAMRETLCYRVLSPYTDWLCAHLPISGYVWLVLIGVIDAFCMIPLQFTLWLADVPHALRHLPHLDPARILANGVVVGGFLGYHLFYHTSSSQVYFALVAMLFASLLAVAPLERLLVAPEKHVRRALVGVIGAAALCTTAFQVGCYTRQGLAQLAATTGIRQAEIPADSWTANDAEALQWLRENTDDGARFATNRTSHTPELLDAISNGCSALSGRAAYMEGWTYAMTNMGVDKSVIAAKQEVNAALFGGCTAAEAEALGERENIQYLVLCKRWAGTPPQGLAPVYENCDMAIYQIVPDRKE